MKLDGRSIIAIRSWSSAFSVRHFIDYLTRYIFKIRAGLPKKSVWSSIQDHLNFTTLPQFKAIEAVVVPLARTMPPRIIHVHFKQGLPSFKPTSIVEFITLKRQDQSFSWDLEVVHQSIGPFINVASQKGLGMTFYGVVHEDPKEFIILFDWESPKVCYYIKYWELENNILCPKAREAVQTDETWTKFLESTSPADKESRLLTPYPFREQRNVDWRRLIYIPSC